MKSEGEGKSRRLAFRLNIDQVVVAGPAHPLTIEQGADGPLPYLDVRGGLRARLARPVYYELATLALDEGNIPPGLWSDGVFVALDGA